MTRVLVTGAGGQLGRAVVRVLDEPGREVIAADRAALDVGDRDAVVGAITALAPDVIIHAAAMTDVDGCEADPDRAFRVNAMGTRHVTDGARRVGAHVVAISTDYVFDGETDRPYVEWDPCNPLSVYGRSKRAAELEVDPAHAVVRTTWVYGREQGLVPAILRLGLGGGDRGAIGVMAPQSGSDHPDDAAAATRAGELRFVDDNFACPTFVDDLTPAVCQIALSRLPGTFHVTNQTGTTPYDLARLVLGLAGEDPDRVVAVTSEELGRAARRPVRSDLDNAALRLSGLPLLPDHREPVERLVKELLAP